MHLSSVHQNPPAPTDEHLADEHNDSAGNRPHDAAASRCEPRRDPPHGSRHEPGREMLTAEAIQCWMAARVAEALQTEPGEVDVRLPFAGYGLDSIVAFSLTGDLAEWLDRDLPATLLWEHPTIEALSRHLAEETGFSPLLPMTGSSWDGLDEGRL